MLKNRGVDRRHYIPSGLTSQVAGLKYDMNNHGPMSTDLTGCSDAWPLCSWHYPEANYSMRQMIFEEHKSYTLGLTYYMANDPGMPSDWRKEMQKWGLCKDEFQDTDNFPPHMYLLSICRYIFFEVCTRSSSNGWGICIQSKHGDK